VFRGTFIQAEACTVLNGNLPKVEKLQIYLRFRLQQTLGNNLFSLQGIIYMWDFRLPPKGRWELRSSGLLRSELWWPLTDVSGQYMSPIFKGQESNKAWILDPW